MGQLRRFELRSMLTDELLFEGTAPECEKFCGTDPGKISNAYNNTKSKSYHGMRIVLVEESSEKDISSFRDRRAVEKWDEFVTPIRERYGIPVYKPGKDGAR